MKFTTLAAIFLSGAAALAACSPIKASNMNSDPTTNRARHAPNPRKAYRITLKIDKAPGPFAVVEGYAQYDVSNESTCGYINPQSGAPERITSNEPFTLTRVADGVYQGTVYTDLMLDEDYFGRGVCHWEFTAVSAFLQATGAKEETRFMPGLDGPDVLAGAPSVTHFLSEGYPRVLEMDAYPDFGHKLEEFRPELRDKTFGVSLQAERLP